MSVSTTTNTTNNTFVLVVCLNPTIQKTFVLPHLWEGEVNRAKEHHINASGKGANVCRVLGQLGQRSVYLCQTGPREVSASTREYLALAAAEGIDVHAVECDGVEVRGCYTLLSAESHTSTEVVEEGRPVQADAEGKVRRAFSALVARADCAAVVITGSKAPGFSKGLYPDLVAEAKGAGRVVVVDYRGDDLANTLALPRERLPDVIKPNLSEFVQTFLKGREPQKEGEAESREVLEAVRGEMERLRRERGVCCVVTRGARDTLFVGEDGAMRTAEVTPVETPVNTIGCGDAFTAGLVQGMISKNGEGGGEKCTMEECIRKAQMCGYKNALSLTPGSIL